MKYPLKSLIGTALLAFIFAGCSNYRKLINDEIVLKDGNSQTGTIVQCDSANLRLKKIDESISIIPWSAIDTVQGKKLQTLWYGINFGYYNTPYFSVFRNKSMTGKQWGVEYKIGLAARGFKLYYLNLTYSPATPYAITKFGFGYQHYLGLSTYLKRNSFFIGTELNLMNAKYNTSAQLTFEPFTGFEKKCNEYIRVHFKFGLQTNLANKNRQTGFNLTIGVHFMRRNFKRYYGELNQERRIPRR